MRRKSERVKDKDKTVDKKADKASKKTRTRSSRRRKKSSSTSPDSSEAEDYDTSLRSGHDTEEETTSGKSRREKIKLVHSQEEDAVTTVTDASIDEKVTSGRSRRYSKKQTAEEAEADAELISKSAEKSVEDIESKGEATDPKHKDKEGKSSVWQVKSADCSSGEIQKLKICIVRPPEPSELSPRKRKKLSRSSHRDVEGESSEGVARDSSGERRKSRRSHRNVSDDSTSPDKKGKHHKSGESSEDGQRTQDSEEMVHSITEVTVDKLEETSQDEIVSVIVQEACEPIEKTSGATDPLEVRDPLEERSESPLVVFVEEKSNDSSNRSPEPSPEPQVPVDPFDALATTVPKSPERKTSVEEQGIKETIPKRNTVTCDTTQDIQELEGISEPSQSVEKMPLESGSPVQTEEICDSSVQVSADPVDKVDKEDISSEEKTQPSENIDKPLIFDEIKNERSPSKPVSRDSSEERKKTQDMSEKSCKLRDLSVETLEAKDASEDPNRRDSSKERSQLRDSSKERSHNISERRPHKREPSEERQKSHRHRLSRGSPPCNSPETKSRSRRLNRHSVGDKSSSRAKVSSPQKSPVPEIKVDKQEEIPEDVEHSPEKEKVKSPPKKVKEDEDKQEARSRTRTRVVWEEKPQIEGKRPIPEIVQIMVEKQKEILKDVEHSPEKEKVKSPPKKVDEAKQEARSRTRTKVVWEEKPQIESKRSQSRAESPSKSNIISIDRNTKRSTSNDLGNKRNVTPSDPIDLHNATSSDRTEKQSPPKPREKFTLKRSISTKSKAVIEDALKENEPTTADGGSPEQTDVKEAAIEPSQNVARKRRWGASKRNNVAKKPVLSISSDSLKNLIPEAKPLTMSEVQLSQEDTEEGEVGDDSSPIPSDMERDVDQEKEVPVRATRVIAPLIPEGPMPHAPIVLTDDHKVKPMPGRKISIMTEDMRSLHRSPSPARNRPSDVLFVTNLVRPFTLNQLKELLARTGTLVEDGFWIDKIKSKCYVQYVSEPEARETRHALHGVRWPVSNPKQLCVDYAKREDLDSARDLAETNQLPRKAEPIKVDVWERERERERERLGREREKVEKEMQMERERTVKMPVREWDLGKLDAGSQEDGRLSREGRNREKERRMRKERDYRSPSPRDGPARKLKKKEEDAPAKLLDDLFKKTKVTPCIYWLPLTAEQIVVKEEMRRKHMAEHERRMAEMRKAEKERVRDRIQGRPPPRRIPDNNRDKRRRRSASASPKK